MNNSEKFRWIRDIDISSFYDKLPSLLKEAIAKAEEADRKGELCALYELQDNIEILAKPIVPDVITNKEWEMLCLKYYPIDD